MVSVPPPPPNSIPGGPIIPPNILLLVGPIFTGNIMDWLLLGVLTMQLYVYHLCFPKDRWWIKLSAYGLYILDLVQTLFVTIFAWTALCQQWGNPAALMHTNWGFSMTPVVSGAISGWVQIFFALRVWTLGRSPLWTAIAVVIIAIALTQAGAGVATGIIFAHINDIQKIHVINKLALIGLAGSAITDCLIAASMAYFLVSAERKSMWSKSSNKRITKLIRSIVETGVLSAAAASLDLALFIGFPHNNLHIAVGTTLSKLYSNALLASLNSRAGVYERTPVSSTREQDTSGYFNTVQFTSVGAIMTVDDEVSISETAGGEQAFKMKTGHTHLGIPMVD